MTTFIFRTRTQAEVEADLAALDAERHAAHRPGESRRYCPLCPAKEAAR